jgi:hypothetical protein
VLYFLRLHSRFSRENLIKNANKYFDRKIAGRIYVKSLIKWQIHFPENRHKHFVLAESSQNALTLWWHSEPQKEEEGRQNVFNYIK